MAAKKGSRGDFVPFRLPLAESRGGASGGVWGDAPTVPRATISPNALNKGAGSEASLPVTKKPSKYSSSNMGGDRRRSPEGDRGLRPFSLPSGSCSFHQYEREINLGCLKKQTIFSLFQRISPLRRRQGGFPVAPLTPSVATTGAGISSHHQ